MALKRVLTILLAFWVLATGAAHAVEGTSTAGPIGGTDLRAAQLPPPGLYAGSVLFHAEAKKFYDGGGRPVAALRELDLQRRRVGAFLYWVPQVEVLGGSVGVLGFVSVGEECGHLFAASSDRCITGAGDPYLELDWTRFFGTVRPSAFAGAYPIAEGLTLQLGLGLVVPVGKYEPGIAARQGLVIGNGIWDIAPLAAFTYVTRPLLFDGTELSAKAYWNNYLRNSDTRYQTGDLLDIDFALTEMIGRLQVGLAGFYAFQLEDDRLNGAAIPPDGRRARVLNLGGVVAYDMPEYATSAKLKALRTDIHENTPRSWGIAFSLVTKLK